MSDLEARHIEIDMLRDRIGKNFDRKLVERKVHHAAIFHADRRADEIDGNLNLDFFAGMNDDEVDMTYAIRYRMELHLAQNAAHRRAIEIEIDRVRFIRINERAEVQLF